MDHDTTVQPFTNELDSGSMEMTSPILDHPWEVSIEEAEKIQMELSDLVQRTGSPSSISMLAAVETAYRETDTTIHVGIALFNYPDLVLQRELSSTAPVQFPYSPGLLAFREAPAILSAISRLTENPDLLFVHGHGVAHPLRFGMACHLGVRLGIPCIGIAKSLLVGTFEQIKRERGCCTPIMDSGEVIGAAVRTQNGKRPIFVSVGHRINLPAAIELTLASTTRYHWPDPLRAARRLAVTHATGATPI